MDMTADEVQLFYQQKVREEKRKSMQDTAQRVLVLSVVIFLISVMIRVLAGGEPPGPSYIPSATRDNQSLRFDYRIAPRLEPLLIPISEDRK
jgi:hypothetical protein